MRKFNAAAYFARRAPGYQNALTGCPSARVLDLVPYVAALSASGLQKRKSLRVCDAFGGTGFLARSLHGNRFSFVVCDCCQEMLTGALGLPRVSVHVTPDDFCSTIRVFGGGFFDLVLCHGGLHHIVAIEKASVKPVESQQRQLSVVSRLAKLVRPGGVLVIADIPENEPPELSGPVWDQKIDPTFFGDCLGHEGLQLVAAATGVKVGAETTLKSIQQAVLSKLVKPFPSSVPRVFFDSFVAKETVTGHTASYVDFAPIHVRLIQEGLLPLGRINYRGPWLFSSANEAGWFFREKFSVGESSAESVDIKSELSMAGVLKRLLGVRKVTTGVAVNWGVTYGIYQKLEGVNEN